MADATSIVIAKLTPKSVNSGSPWQRHSGELKAKINAAWSAPSGIPTHIHKNMKRKRVGFREKLLVDRWPDSKWFTIGVCLPQRPIRRSYAYTATHRPFINLVILSSHFFITSLRTDTIMLILHLQIDKLNISWFQRRISFRWIIHCFVDHMWLIKIYVYRSIGIRVVPTIYIRTLKKGKLLDPRYKTDGGSSYQTNGFQEL